MWLHTGGTDHRWFWQLSPHGSDPKGHEASRSFSRLWPTFLSRLSIFSPTLTNRGLVFIGENKLSHPTQHCWTRNAMRIPTWVGTGGSTQGPTQRSTCPSSRTMAPSSRRLLPPRPGRSVPGTLPQFPLHWLWWGQILKLSCSPAGWRGSQTLEKRGVEL